ncbi:MAG: arginine--tRNA ligase [Nitrososphaerota archaeon]|nr:arginine--tRNA ligase [Nitrososphaerota archaeon]MDG6919731.1 arginine--tRNA ligase [Nitrososphaerota archaeon]MDG6941985.1 arginine--tRNA ligase [Nitrososphaerota archaeon]
MKFLDFQAEVEETLASACRALGYKDAGADVSLPPNDSYGDLASAVAIRIAKDAGRSPGDLAVEIGAKAMDLARRTKYIGGVSPHKGGFVNFGINRPRFLLDAINGILAGDLGTTREKGEVVAVEHTNVNPNKALHIGHARNLVLGDSLVRVMRYLGQRVQALNYVDDSGAQVADIIVGFKFMGLPDEAPPGAKYDVYCGDNVYSRVTKEYETRPSLKEKQSLVLKEIEKGSGELAEYTRGIVRKILAAQLSTCWRLGATYDLLNWESQLVHSGMWEKIFESLKKMGYVRLQTQGENEGCWVIPDPDTGEEKVVVRSDGTAVYVAKDIPYAAWKIGLIGDPFGYEVYSGEQPGGPLYSTTLSGGKAKVHFGGAELAVSVIDARQSYLQKIVAKVLDKFREGASRRYVHRGYEVVALSKKTASQLGFGIDGEFVHMSGRKGLYVNVDTVLDRLKEKAKAETRRRNLSEAEGWVDEVAEAVAVAALRYELLKQDPDKMIVFDMDDALQFQGDTGPYLVYTYARARRILGKTEGRPRITLESAAKLGKPQEARLAKKMSMLDLAAETAGEFLSPREIAKFAHELAMDFNDFYESVPVNQEPDQDTRDARLALVDAASRVLAEAMRLIGVPVKERI